MCSGRIIRLLTIYILLCNSQDAIGRRHKRKLIFVRGRQSHWNDHVRYCQTTFSGRLLTEENATIHHVLQKFVNEQWSADWNSDVWNGLYVSNIAGNEYYYQWQGTCTEPDYFNWEQERESSDKMCTKMDKSNLQWKNGKCDESKYSICEKYIGPCTYEDDSVLGSCSIDSDSIEHTGLNSSLSCQEMCSKENDCWAVNYKTGICWLSYSRDPFYFDSSGSVYSSSCPETILRDAKLSWKRCFESEIDTTPIPTYSYSPPTEPIPLCNLLAQPTTQFYDEITTSVTKQPTTIQDDHMTTTEQPSSLFGRSTTTRALYEQSTTIGGDRINLSEPPSAVGNVVTSSSNRSTTVATHSNEFTEPSHTLPSSESADIVIMSENTTLEPTEEQNELCLCECFVNDSFDIARYVENIIVNLKRDRKNMSNYKRKLISADDHRFSAKTIGLSLGVGVIVTVILAIILSDVCKVLKLFKWYAYDGVHKQRRRTTV